MLLLGNLLAVAVYCSLFTLIEMLTSSRAGAIVITMLLFLLLLVLGTVLIGRLQRAGMDQHRNRRDQSGQLIF